MWFAWSGLVWHAAQAVMMLRGMLEEDFCLGDGKSAFPQLCNTACLCSKLLELRTTTTVLSVDLVNCQLQPVFADNSLHDLHIVLASASACSKQWYCSTVLGQGQQ